MLSVSKPVSLLELKKQQWAREREEMSHLYLPWGSGERYNNRVQSKNQFASNLELHKQQNDYQEQESIHRQRSPSLPPIHQLEPDRQKESNGRVREILNRNLSSAKRFAFYDEDGEGDTSGYGSETINHLNKRNSLQDCLDGRTNPVMAWQQDKSDNKTDPTNIDRSGHNTWVSRSPRSSTGDEGRPRWGDRGVATGRLWEPTTPNARLPQMPNQNKGTPSWVERGLNMIDNSSEVFIVDQSSTNSGHECDRSSCNGSEEGRTFLRGQNVPLEPEVRAQRENKRLKAMELQSAILSQLEDREKRRQEEREIKLQEERLEELRLQRQQEQDRIRLEEEKRKNEERMATEQRKLDTLKKALEDAERKAREEKEKRFIAHKQTRNINCQNQDLKDSKPKVEENYITSCEVGPEVVSPTKSNRTYSLHSAKSQKKDNNSQHTTEFSSPRSGTGSNNVNLFIHSVPPISLNDTQYSLVPIGINGEVVNGPASGVQLAVLVPQGIQNLCNVSLNSVSIGSEACDGEKILTPSKYRTLRTKDACTQTDAINYSKLTETEDLHRDLNKTYAHIDENAPQDSNHNTLKKERRFRSEERYKKDLENRPKWGVNRPAAQYKKQSEKDPFYSQKRKIRQKYRPQQRQYLSQSSEDSRSPSPPVRLDKNENNKHRNSISQSYWKNKKSGQDVPKNIYDSEINNAFDFHHTEPTSNLSGETINKSPKMSPTKRLTLSQKFINDKYGNKKLWVDDVYERHQKINVLEGENRKKMIEQLNVAKRDYLCRNFE